MYHIGIDNSHGAKYAVLPGDPGRVEKIALLLDEPEYLCTNREYTSWLGRLDGEKVIVMSTGIGGPSAAIAAEELCQTGVHTMIRTGTCGGMDVRVKGGDLVVATGAVRMEGTTKEYLPVEFPAVPDLQVLNALVSACRSNNAVCHTGVVQSKDSFYGQHDPNRMPVGYELNNKWGAWLGGHCLASEMETAALFIVAQTLGIRAGSVLGVLWNQERRHRGLSDENVLDTGLAVKTAVDAIRLLIHDDRLMIDE
jgi:uridine phosphorylase